MTQSDNSRILMRIDDLRDRYPLNDKVLLIQVPLFLYDSFNPEIARNGGAYAYPPVGLQFVKSALAGRGLEIDILDLNYELLTRTIKDKTFSLEQWTDILDARLEESGATIFGVACTCVPGHPSDPRYFFTDIMRRIREKDLGIIIAGGSIATKHNEFFLNQDHCDFVVSGEGEQKAQWLFDRLKGQPHSGDDQAGIFYKDLDGIGETTGVTNSELSSSVLETYADIPIEDYWRLGCLNPFSKMASASEPDGPAKFCTMQLNRGCRANCKFCGVYEFMGKGVRQRETDNVIEEIRYLVEERGCRHVDILDDDFLGISRHREGLFAVLETIADLRQKYGNISWAAGNGLVAASLDEEILELMDRAGCIGFRIGIESGNDEMLKHLRRPSNKKAVRKAAEMIQKYPGIFVSGNYIIGLFGKETFGEIMDTFRFSRGLQLDWSGFSVFQFTSKLEEENQSPGEKSTNDFVPSRDHWLRLMEGDTDIISGPGVFDLNPSLVPAPAQVKEIWFAFNLVANYIGNKNLRPGGRPDKLNTWIDAVYLSYPGNAYMPLFSGLTHVLMGENDKAAAKLEEARENLRVSDYWRWRFDGFALNDLVEDFPTDAEQVTGRLNRLYETLYPTPMLAQAGE